MDKPFVYLACPYSDPDLAVRRFRFVEATRAAAKLTKQGFTVFSPITHSHPMAAVNPDLPGDLSFWGPRNSHFLDHSCKMVVLKLPGWERSAGVQAEIAFCEDNGIPVEYSESAEDDKAQFRGSVERFAGV